MITIKQKISTHIYNKKKIQCTLHERPTKSDMRNKINWWTQGKVSTELQSPCCTNIKAHINSIYKRLAGKTNQHGPVVKVTKPIWSHCQGNQCGPVVEVFTCTMHIVNYFARGYSLNHLGKHLYQQRPHVGNSSNH